MARRAVDRFLIGLGLALFLVGAVSPLIAGAEPLAPCDPRTSAAGLAETPAATATPEPAPNPAPQPLPGPPIDLGVLTANWSLIVGGCLILLALILGTVLLLLLLRRRKARSQPSPKPAPAPVPAESASSPTSPRLAPQGDEPHLEAIDAAGQAQRFGLPAEGITIGRAAENDLVVTDELPGWETVSQRHARIVRRDERWTVEDLGSTNGVYVNGARTGRNLLRDGWRLHVGGVSFVFHAGAEEAER